MYVSQTRAAKAIQGQASQLLVCSFRAVGGAVHSGLLQVPVHNKERQPQRMPTVPCYMPHSRGDEHRVQQKYRVWSRQLFGWSKPAASSSRRCLCILCGTKEVCWVLSGKGHGSWLCCLAVHNQEQENVNMSHVFRCCPGVQALPEKSCCGEVVVVVVLLFNAKQGVCSRWVRDMSKQGHASHAGAGQGCMP